MWKYVDFVGVFPRKMLLFFLIRKKTFLVGYFLTSGFLVTQPIRCLLHHPVE